MWWLLAAWLLFRSKQPGVSGYVGARDANSPRPTGGDHRASSGANKPGSRGAALPPGWDTTRGGGSFNPGGATGPGRPPPGKHIPTGHGSDYAQRASAPIPDDVDPTQPPIQPFPGMGPYGMPGMPGSYGGGAGDGTSPASWQAAMDQAYGEFYEDMYADDEEIIPGVGPGHWERAQSGEAPDTADGRVWVAD